VTQRKVDAAAQPQPTGEQAQKARDAARADLEKQRKEFQKALGEFQQNTSFGMGAIWRAAAEGPIGWRLLWFEFIGSLLTGILVSIGAPYWHNLLRALLGVRGKSASGQKV
jgi:hypothetical protein